MYNNDIRETAKAKGVYLWEIAEKLGQYDTNFSKMMRKEFTDDMKEKIFQIIDELSAKKNK